jgi:hypothetical protein
MRLRRRHIAVGKVVTLFVDGPVTDVLQEFDPGGAGVQGATKTAGDGG